MAPVPGPRLMALSALAALGLGVGVAALVAGGRAPGPGEPEPPAQSIPVSSAATEPTPATPPPTTDPAPPSPTETPTPEPVLAGGANQDCGGPESYEPPKVLEVYFYTSMPGEGDGTNGRMPVGEMVSLDWCVDSQGNPQWLRADAAAALAELNMAFVAEFGENVAIDLSYRSYEDQVAMREHYGSIAARPGTSSHGWGTAVDLNEWAAYAFDTPRYDWLVANGPDYGWIAPDWARADGVNPEYWHYEYVG